MRACVFISLLLPLTALAQEQATPAEAEEALRARVNEFFQDFVDAQYRKALDLVAEETKDEYFASGKMEIKSFKIDDVKLDPGLAKAIVNLSVKRVWRVRLEQMIVDISMPTTWKLEKGKWCWYHEILPNTHVTPMGPSDVDLITRKPDGSVKLPENITPEAVITAAQKILQLSNVDKQAVTLSVDQPSSEKVVFHNGAQGSVSLELSGVPSLPGFTAKLDKSALNFGEDAILQVQYTPPPDREKTDAPAPADLVLTVSPFHQQFHVRVNFQASK